MSNGYSATLEGGQEVYIPYWPASVALGNLTKAGQYIGSDNLLRIVELNIPAVMVAIMGSADQENTAKLIKHFVCEARMDGEKISPSEYDHKFQGNLFLVAELFAHVVKAQYADFFVQGLAKAPSQEV